MKAKSHSNSHSHSNSESNTNFVAFLILAGNAIAFSYLLVSNFVLEWEYPRNTFLYTSLDRFFDFFNVNIMAFERSPYSLEFAYPPFAFLYAFPFSQITNFYELKMWEISTSFEGRLSFGLFLFIFFIGSTWLLEKSLSKVKFKSKVALYLSFFSCYPLIFAVDRGNYILHCFLFFWWGAISYKDKKSLSSFLIAVAGSFKIYPLIFLLVPLVDKKFRYIVNTLAWVCALNLLALFAMKGTVVENGILFFKNLMNLNQLGQSSFLLEVCFQNSLNSFIKVVEFLMQRDLLYKGEVLLALKGLLFVLLCFFVKTEKRFELRLLALTYFFILIPNLSFDYILIFLWVPLLQILTSTEKNELKFQLVCISFLLVPKVYYILFFRSPSYYYVSIQPLLNSFVLILAFFVLTVGGARKTQGIESLMRVPAV